MRLCKRLNLCQQAWYKSVAFAKRLRRRIASGGRSSVSKIVGLLGGEVEARGKILNPNSTIRVTPLKVCWIGRIHSPCGSEHRTHIRKTVPKYIKLIDGFRLLS